MSEEKKKEKRIKIEKDSDDIPIEDIKELFGVINQEVPGLIKGLLNALYSAETAEQFALGIGTIYKTLTEQGLPDDLVLAMVNKYADSINVIGSAMQNININTKKKHED